MKKIIGVDIADTIVDVWPNLMEKADSFNKNYSNNIKSNNKCLYLPEDIYKWTTKETIEFWKLYRDDLTFNSPIKNGVKTTLTYLKNLKYSIWLITAKTNSDYIDLEKKIIKMLTDNEIPYDKIFTQINNKGEFCKQNNISYLVDDSYKNCLSAINNGKIGLLIDNFYNENRIIVPNMYRIKKFEDIKKYIKR